MTQTAMYNWRVRAVTDALANAGKAEGPLNIDDLTALGHLDQYHYYGTQACDEVIETLGLGPGTTVLDIGSGIGGPGRYMAAMSGCSVVGVEMQTDLCEAATALTARVPGLAERVVFCSGDATDPSLQLHMPPGGFDHFVSQLVNLHVPDRRKLLASTHARIAPGGTFVIEDFAAITPPSANETRALVDLVNAPSVTSVGEYVAELESVGFVDVEATDLSRAWTAWTTARSREYDATEADVVAKQGQRLFDDRRLFYRGVADLFEGGRVGGIRITGRKPGKHELTLRTARQRGMLAGVAAAPHKAARILEGGAAYEASGHGANGGPQDPAHDKKHTSADAAGDTSHGVWATQATNAQLLVGAQSAQPPLPWRAEPAAGLHDSLQYHFFLGPLFVAVRVFHTASLQSISAWAYDASEPHAGAVELLNTYEPLTPPAGGATASLHLENDEIGICDGGADGLYLTLTPKSEAATALLTRAGVAVGAAGRPELRIDAAQGHAYGWMPAGFESAADRPVIHRPTMTASVAQWRGVAHHGYGYSKRYHGIYPRHNGWRFIHGVTTPDGATPDPITPLAPPHVLWTADATFGDDKYNYFKLLPTELHASGALLESASTDTYQQQDAAFGLIGGERVTASLREVAKWHTIIGGGAAGAMESKMENRLCELTLQVGTQPPTKGIAYNERVFGTLW